jgi:phosphatidate cytidylyltransferase
MSRTSHAQRLLTALVLLAVVALALYLQGFALFALMALVGSLALLEFYAMFWPAGAHFMEKIVALPMLWCMFWVARNGRLSLLIGFLILAFAYAAVRFLLSFGNGNETAFTEWTLMPAGLLYIGCFLSPALALSLTEQILVLLAPAISDVGGYYVGMRFGKRKIWPRVSPNKSWMGSLGGMCACVALCLIAGLLWGRDMGMPGSVFAFLFLGVLLNLASQFGDFFESALKRTQGVKDSGKLLPGHGGLLDRIDSLLFAVPMYVLLNLFFDFFA